jgi:hypothetical protein
MEERTNGMKREREEGKARKKEWRQGKGNR